MQINKGTWKAVLYANEAKGLEQTLKETRRVIVDDSNPDKSPDLKFWTVVYWIFISPRAESMIPSLTPNDIEAFIEKYHYAQIKMAYDYRMTMPLCTITFSEKARQYLEANMWRCNGDHAALTLLLPELRIEPPRCSRCGSKMLLVTKPVLPNLADIIKGVEIDYDETSDAVYA